MGTQVETVAIELALGAFIGFCMGLTGVGGGVLLLPALTAVLGLSPSMAVGTACSYAALTRVYATWEHHRLGTIDLRAGLILLIGAVPGTWFAARFVKERAADPGFQQLLGWVITGAIITSGLLMALKIVRDRTPEFALTTDDEGVESPPLTAPRLAIWLGLGAMTGVLIASTSVGGAVILIPILVFFFRLPIVKTVGTSIFISLVLAALAGAVYLLGEGQGQVAVGTALWMWAGSLFGVRAGSRQAARLEPRILQGAVVGMILVSALVMVAKMSQV